MSISLTRVPCPRCAMQHRLTACPNVVSIELHPNGRIKTVVFR